MGLFDAKTSSKGQVTVPVEVRRLIGLEAGGKIQFQTDAEGRVYVTAKKRSIKALKGCSHSLIASRCGCGDLPPR